VAGVRSEEPRLTSPSQERQRRVGAQSCLPYTRLSLLPLFQEGETWAAVPVLSRRQNGWAYCNLTRPATRTPRDNCKFETPVRLARCGPHGRSTPRAVEHVGDQEGHQRRASFSARTRAVCEINYRHSAAAIEETLFVPAPTPWRQSGSVAPSRSGANSANLSSAPVTNTFVLLHVRAPHELHWSGTPTRRVRRAGGLP
jgi:hypothetical protein